MHDNDFLMQRLVYAESDFLDALDGGVLDTALKTRSLGHETFSLAHSIASRIANVANCFLDVRRGAEFFTASLQSDCDAMLHQMVTLDLNANPKSLQPENRNHARSHSHSFAPISGAESSSPPFLFSTYRWLVDNLHNPYPTAEVKTRIATASSSKVSSINSWFVNARRRIGWTTLCREHFSNCRADIIDAAYRALVEEDPRRPLSPKLMHSFVALKVAAEGLYPTTFTRDAFARDLDSIMKGITEKDNESTEIEKSRKTEHANHTMAIRDPYPSPDRSSVTSSLPALDDSLTDASEEVDDVAPPPIIAGFKRPRSSVEPPDQPSCTTNRPIKRLRAATVSQTYLPSPRSSTDGVDEPSDHSSPEVSDPVHSTPLEINQLPARKRCVSDANATGVSKRPRSSTSTPHPQVSLPLSHMENEYSIDGWFNTDFDTLFDIPPPVDAMEPDFSSAWEVELFRNYSIPENPKLTMRCPSVSASVPQLSAPTDLCDFESLLQSIEGDPSVVPLEGVPTSDVTAVNSLIPGIPDVSPTDVDWTSLLNSTETYQPVVDSIFLHYSSDPQLLPVIDIPMLQLPQVTPVSNSQADFESKQAKLQRLHALQEAVRRMEQELQSEGIVE